MSKLLVINSFGPMGSTLLAGLCEKFGFSNVPLRKLGLHAYLMGQRDLNSGYMQSRLKKVLESHSCAQHYGGVSVLDRDNQNKKALVDISRAKDELEELDKQTFTSIQDLYNAVRQIYYKTVIYKEMHSNPEWHIMMTVDFHRFDPDELYRRYIDSFDEVYFIHLHRDFRSWINSLSTQAMRQPSVKERLKFFPHLRYADFSLYERATSNIPGLQLQFDDLFDKPIKELAGDISTLTGVDVPEINFETATYDLYGKDTPFERAFTRFDDNACYLPEKTLDYLKKKAEDGSILEFPENTISWVRYILGIRYFRTNFS